MFWLDVIFANRELERLYSHNEGASKYPAETIRLLRRRVRHIEAAKDLQDLQSPRSVGYNQLGGKHSGKFVLCLADDYCLVLSEERNKDDTRIVIHEISKDY